MVFKLVSQTSLCSVTEAFTGGLGISRQVDNSLWTCQDQGNHAQGTPGVTLGKLRIWWLPIGG